MQSGGWWERERARVEVGEGGLMRVVREHVSMRVEREEI